MLKIFLDQNLEKQEELDDENNSILNVSIIYDQIDIFIYLFKNHPQNLLLKNVDALTTFEIALQKGNLEILASFQKKHQFNEKLFTNFKLIRNVLYTQPNVFNTIKN